MYVEAAACGDQRRDPDDRHGDADN